MSEFFFPQMGPPDEMQAAVVVIGRVNGNPDNATKHGVRMGVHLFACLVLGEKTRRYRDWWGTQEFCQDGYLGALIHQFIEVFINLFQAFCDVGIAFGVFRAFGKYCFCPATDLFHPPGLDKTSEDGKTVLLKLLL